MYTFIYQILLYPFLRNIAVKMLCNFPNMEHIKSKHRNRLTDETLSHIYFVFSLPKQKLISVRHHQQSRVLKTHIKQVVVTCSNGVIFTNTFLKIKFTLNKY